MPCGVLLCPAPLKRGELKKKTIGTTRVLLFTSFSINSRESIAVKVLPIAVKVENERLFVLDRQI